MKKTILAFTFLASLTLFPVKAEAKYFTAGVASGDPTSKSVIIWTKIDSEPDAFSSVEYEVAKDKEFKHLVNYGDLYTDKMKDQTIKIDVKNLKPETTYYYRFIYKHEYSEVGKTKTLPERARNFRVAFVSCQNYGAGFFTAYQHIIKDNPDIVVMLGDSIYEHAKYKNRKDESGFAENLEAYRNKYKYYLTDPFYKEARKLLPFVFIWDDHEVKNDYSGVEMLKNHPKQLNSAYQAFFEYTPIRKIKKFRIYRNITIGNLLNLYLIDGRQYRDENPCKVGEVLNVPCTLKSYNENKTYLGKEQKEWLKTSLKDSSTTWNVLANNTMMMESDFLGTIINYDEWDGYMKEKNELLDFIYDNNIKNNLIFTGDLHTFIQGVLTKKNKKIGTEFVTSSVTPYLPHFSSYLKPLVSLLKPFSGLFIKNLNFFEPEYRGYILADFSTRKTEVYFYGVSSVLNMDTDRKLLKKFEVIREK